MKVSKAVQHFPLYFVFLLLFQSNVTAQTLGFTVDCGDAEIGSVYCAPVRVFGFNQMISAQLSFNWDETVLSFKELQNQNLDHLDGSYFPLSTSELALSWVDFGYVGINKPDSTVIFDLCFDVIGSLGDTSNILILPPSNSGVMEISNLDGIIPNGDIDFVYSECPSTVVMSVATKETNETLFQMFPNPATKYIQIDSEIPFSTIQISDNNGKTILTKDFETLTDVSQFQTGWYLISLSNDTETAIQKLFIIQEE